MSLGGLVVIASAYHAAGTWVQIPLGSKAEFYEPESFGLKLSCYGQTDREQRTPKTNSIRISCAISSLFL